MWRLLVVVCVLLGGQLQAQIDLEQEISRTLTLMHQLQRNGQGSSAIDLGKNLIKKVEGVNPESCALPELYAQQAMFLQYVGQWQEGEKLARRALEAGRECGKAPGFMANIQHVLGMCLTAGADPKGAYSAYAEALALWRGDREEYPPTSLSALAAMASCQITLGDYYRAARYLTIAEDVINTHPHGVEHHVKLSVYNTQVQLYMKMGENEQALKKHDAYMQGMAEVVGANSPVLAREYLTQAIIQRRMGNHDIALEILQIMQPTLERAFGKESPYIATALHLRSNSLAALGKFEEAFAEQEQAMGIVKKHNLPPILQAGHYNNLGYYSLHLGDLDTAEQHLRRSIELTDESGLSEDSANTRASLALVLAERGQTRTGMRTLYEAVRTYADLLEEVTYTGSETQLVSFSTKIRGKVHALIQMNHEHLADDPQAAAAAFQVLLWTKGRIADGIGSNLATVRHLDSDAGDALLKELAIVQARQAAVTWAPVRAATYQAVEMKYLALRVRQQELETRLMQMAGKHRTERPMNAREVARRMPADAALVEYFLYRPWKLGIGRVAEDEGEWQLVAYVLRPDASVATVPLGGNASIEQAIRTWREGIGRKDATGKQAAARALYTRLIEPIEPLLGDARHLILAPDGVLTRLPFEALVDGDGRYLGEHRLISYVGCARDLLRLEEQAEKPREGQLVVVANPAYNAPPLTGGQQGTFMERENLHFTDLPGTAAEAAALVKLFPKALVLTGADARERQWRRFTDASVLHVATHGFFEASEKSTDGARGLVPLSPASAAPPRPTTGAGTKSPFAGNKKSPMLYSGLAMAGANHEVWAIDLIDGDPDDGLLTALELSTLDLSGTRLAVLSACETGLGELLAGEGVFGLRRALAVAGVDSQVMSLWKVDDDGTAAFMVQFYTQLRARKTVAEALQAAKLAMLADEQYSDPFYWAPFILIGDWRNLNLELD